MKANQSIVTMAQKFNVNVRHVDVIRRGVYRLVAKTGEQYCLKRMGYPLDCLNWMDSALRGMRRQGFNRIAWRDPQKPQGRILFAKENKGSSPYILTPWLIGRQPQPISPEDMSACAQALSYFHTIGRAVKVSKKGEQNFLGKWPGILQGRFKVLKKALAKAKRSKGRSELDLMLRAHGDELLERAAKSLETLNKSKYQAVCRNRAANEVALCHGDSGPRNFVITAEGPAFIDFETLRIDLRVYDLFRMIRLAGKKNGWDFAIARTILDSYRSVSELTSNEYALLRVWLEFPHKICKILARYQHATKSKQNKMIRKMKKVIQRDQKISPFLHNLAEYARERG